MNAYKSRHFQPAELTCKCGCGKLLVSPSLLHTLDLIRDYLNIPLIVHSASRCPSHNQAVGGSPTSSHLTGFAVDIRAYADVTRFKIIAAAIRYGINRIGVGKTFVHLDNDPTKPAAFWLY